MSVSQPLTRFCVEGLQRNRKLDVDISENTLVIVGENGSGKTTFLMIMFSFLAGRWGGLAQFQFDRISATIGGYKFTIQKDELTKSLAHHDARLLARLPPSVRERTRSLVAHGKEDEAWEIVTRYGVERRFESDLFARHLLVDSKKLVEMHDSISTAMGSQILYLPTYRRIERELSSVLRGLDIDDVRRGRAVTRQVDDADEFVELVEFGMGDVKRAIDSTLEDIQRFASFGSTQLTLSYLGDVVSQKYKSTDRQEIMAASPETVDAVLNRIGDAILGSENKSHLRYIISSAKSTANVPSEHEQIIYHYFSKLLGFQNELRAREQDISQFCNLCSTYIIDKKFVYDNVRFTFIIQFVESGEEIQLSELSSGEKQIVSLFSHLYLSKRERFFVLIDEPELSLSVPWQRRFLEDIRSGSFCSGLVAVTHSPFIYDNSLRKHTHAIGEFIGGPDWGNIS